MENLKESKAQVESADVRCSSAVPCYIISVSYGNDSIALIQWAYEQGLENCYVVYCDTGWAHPEWHKRVEEGMALAEKYDFVTWNVRGMTFAEMVRMKKGFPSQQYQFCSGILKVVPFLTFAETIDPFFEATVLIGKRREESAARKDTPEFVENSEYHEGRKVWHPLYKHREEERNVLIERTGMDVLPHRSMECCPCVNANRQDLRETPQQQVDKVNMLEVEVGHNMFRAYKKQGATGIYEVMEWANSGRGQYIHGQGKLWNYRGELCGSGMCGI